LPKQGVFSKIYNILYSTAVSEVQGVDISRWNGTMNLGITKTKAQYGILRLGYGTQWKDPYVDTYYRDSQINDWPVGLYWYLNIGQDVNLTMKSFAEEIATHRPQLDIVLDAESTTLDPGNTLNWLKDAYNILLGLTNKKPVIYTAAWFWNTKVARSSFWSGKELWVANWTTRDTPTMPYDWYGWTHWQHSAEGNLKASEYGSTGGDQDMDLDRFNGTVAQFNSKYGTHIQPLGGVPPVIPPGTLPEYVIINTGELAIRNAPGAGTIGHALLNTKWYPYELVSSNGVEWYRVGKNAFISKAYTKLP
jgi:GH25 family lysozyme M1 (1,4-beta-N-acetylmuramidase)